MKRQRKISALQTVGVVGRIQLHRLDTSVRLLQQSGDPETSEKAQQKVRILTMSVSQLSVCSAQSKEEDNNFSLSLCEFTLAEEKHL